MKECSIVNVNDLNQLGQQAFLQVGSLCDLKQKIIVLINHRETIGLIEQNVNLFAEKDTDLRNINTIKMSIDTCNHPPIKLRPYNLPFSIHTIVDEAVNDMLTRNIIHPSRSPRSFPIVVVNKEG